MFGPLLAVGAVISIVAGVYFQIEREVNLVLGISRAEFVGCLAGALGIVLLLFFCLRTKNTPDM